MDQETLRMLAMQRVQELILNPESRTLTVFPFPGMAPSSSNTLQTVINQPWMQSSSASDSGKFNVGFPPRHLVLFLIL